MIDLIEGSPPRVRGKVFSEGLLPVIPGDHPRVCGEKSGLMRSNATGTGSPPRVRGKDVSGADATPWIRITPACAGKSFTSMKCFRAIQDHPRVCGEKTEIAYVVFLSEGSPPRVRGKAYRIKPHCVNARITPACAGKRSSVCKHGRTGKDHPRVCGEKIIGADKGLQNPGSPPRVRGKAGCSYAVVCSAGITPACAGKRRETIRHVFIIRDHPRVCGEKLKFIAAVFSMWGSPPRVRGKGPAKRGVGRQPGITPACAGKS